MAAGKFMGNKLGSRLHLLPLIVVFFSLRMGVGFGQTDADSFPAGIYDLESLGWEGLVITGPEGAGNAQCFHFLNGEAGYALFGNRKHNIQLYRYHKGIWERVFLPANKTVYLVFAIEETKYWLTCSTTIPYKENLLYFNGKDFIEVVTPNVEEIVSLEFQSPQFGLAGCIAGQIMKYDGSGWHLVPCPASTHVNAIWLINSDFGLAMSEKPEARLMAYRNGHIVNEPNDCADVRKTMFGEFGHEFDTDASPFVSEIIAKSSVKNTGKVTIQVDSYDTGFLLVSKYLQTIGSGYEKSRIIDNKNKVDRISAAILGTHLESRQEYQFIVFENYCPALTFTVKRSVPAKDKSGFTRFIPDIENDTRKEYGVCIHDFSGDGLEDLYKTETGDGNHLCLSNMTQNWNGSGARPWMDVTESAGLVGDIKQKDGTPYYDSGVTCADIDNDGDQDILVTGLNGRNILYNQVKYLKFRDWTQFAGLPEEFRRSQSAIWADVNGDEFLDLFVSNSRQENQLFLNNGSGFFHDVTKSAGLGNFMGGMGSCFGDIDGDGDADLLIPRHKDGNKLFRNDGCDDKGIPRFSDITETAGLLWQDSTSSAQAGLFEDFDNDGDLDLFLAITTGTNRYYVNDGTGHFHETAEDAGLTGSHLSQAAVALDADNDGDLDIFVANRGGENRFYENLGNNKFREIYNKEYSHAYGYPTGAAAGDLDNDGDIDLYVGNEKLESYGLFNQTNDSRWIKLRLFGSKSNRDAIGAKLYFYQGGHLGDSTQFLGMRHIKAGDGKNSMSSRVVHFGVPDNKPKDVLIKYPSGIEQKLVGVKPAQFLHVYEEEGLDRRLSLLQKWFVRTTRYPPNQREAAYILLFLFVVIAGNVRQKLSPERINDLVLRVAMPLVIFFLSYSYLRHAGAIPHYVFPMLFGFGALIFGLVYTSSRQQAADNREYEEKLFQLTNVFFHGEWGASRINQILLYCRNIQDHQSNKVIRKKLDQYIAEYFELVHPEIEQIEQTAKRAGTNKSAVHSIAGSNRSLLENLLLLKTELGVGRTLDQKLLNRIIDSASTLLYQLRQLRESVLQTFTCDVVRATKNVVSAIDHSTFTVSTKITAGENTQGLIRPAEFSQILQNLINNAQRAVENQNEKKLTIHLYESLDYVFLRISDNGRGIDPSVRSKLFQEQTSTKSNGGGIGLYYSQKILQKYGGKISIIATSAANGTEMELAVKRI